MVPKKELRVVYGLAIVLLIVGVVSYAAFPAKTPEQPVRMMFQSVAGRVLFSHQMHTAPSGYGLSCRDCHHNLEEGETEPPACSQCHEPQSEDPSIPKLSDAFHQQCIGCHQQFGAGPQACNSCHVL